MRPWSNADVVVSVLRGARGPRAKAWLALYLISRRGPAAWRRFAGRLTSRTRDVRLSELAAPLPLPPDGGGLGTWYEIVARRVYSPVPGFAPSAGGVTVDVGANIGVFSLWAAARMGAAGRLVAIEPNPLAVDHLRVALERVETPNDLVVSACGAESGDAVLHFDPARLSTASQHARPDHPDSVSVAVRRLDDILAELGVGEIDFLKVDVEGVELDVLAGAPETLARTRRLVIELDAGVEERAVELVTSHGLEQVAVERGAWGLPDARLLAFSRG